MKSVMLSIQPKWVEKIVNGEKTIEVRKTRPKIDTPFKCYIYCTKKKRQDEFITKSEAFGYLMAPEHTFFNRAKEYDANGKVIGEFMCNKVQYFTPCAVRLCGLDYNICVSDFFATSLTDQELNDYGKGKPLYGWHISELKIYDKPKELSEFRPICKFDGKDAICALFCPNWKYDGGLFFECTRKVTRPPQSLFYVEELCKEQN